ASSHHRDLHSFSTRRSSDLCAPTGTPMPHDIDSPEYVPWLESLRLYADGRTPAKYGPTAVMSQGILEGRFWHTRPDMLISMRHRSEEHTSELQSRGHLVCRL